MKSKTEFIEHCSISESEVNNILKLRRKYKIKSILKTNGKKREINAPIPALKELQIYTKNFLSRHYIPMQCVHGFVRKRNIKTNAQIHCGKKYIINMDLKNFFPSIEYNRIIGVLIYMGFENDLASLIAKIACYHKKLPQGSPCSPILSNIICQRLDRRLTRLSEKCNVKYTRYADDLTFSFDSRFSKSFLLQLKDIIEDEGFNINDLKTHFKSFHQRQSVTNLITNNSKPNIPREQIKMTRTLIHKLNSGKIECAVDIALNKTNFKKSSKPQYEGILSYLDGFISYIGYVRGIEDRIYLKLIDSYNRLPPIP
jgi:RNA-directed DNA polymerase